TYNLAVLTQQEYETWRGGHPTPAVYYSTVSYGAVLAIPVPAGDYVAVVYPVSSPTCPSITVVEKEYLPIGIVSYPLTPISTSELMGFFNITAINAYNPSGESQFGVPNSGASLQFNAVLVVELANGQKQYYFVQNVLSFVTDKNEFNIGDNVWNYTALSSVLSNQTITGNGAVYLSAELYNYVYTSLFTQYSLPFAGYLIMRAYASGGVVHVNFGYVIVQNGSHHPPSVVWFDNVSIIPSAPAVNAYFEVSTELVPSYLPMDAELVFAGYGNSEWTMFNQLSANLAILYWGGSDWVPLPRLFNFGIDTAEGAVPSISVSMSSNGLANVALGSFTPGLVISEPPTPALPMTYVSYYNPVTDQSFSGYITQPMTINFPGTVYVGSGERYVFQGCFVNNEFLTNSSITITPSETWFTQYDVEPVYQQQYLVSIVSPLPIYVNGGETVNYTNWLSPGSQVSIVARAYVLPNGTMFIPGVGNESITVNAPTTLVIAWSPRYLVTVTSTMPIYVNGQLVSNYTAWLSPGTTLTIRAPTYSAYGGLVLYQPNTTSATLTISKPTKLTITYTLNYDRLYIAIGAAVTTIVLVTVIPMSRRKQQRH
ncbi:MAG: thermopsin family protease, partial [Vulcanisaeta sp.]|nr:thermopsin family protease [Vulcanisaeta sp.]